MTHRLININRIAWVFDQAIAHSGRLLRDEAKVEREQIEEARRELALYLGERLSTKVTLQHRTKPHRSKPRGVLP